MGVDVSRFRYLRDGLFLIATFGYALNRWWLKPWLGTPFLVGHLNDLLLIPAALPVVLWMQRLLGLRKDDAPPSWAEISLHLAVWTVISEVIGPRWFGHGTADLWDAVAYAAGGGVAGVWWNRGNRATGLRVGRRVR